MAHSTDEQAHTTNNTQAHPGDDPASGHDREARSKRSHLLDPSGRAVRRDDSDHDHDHDDGGGHAHGDHKHGDHKHASSLWSRTRHAVSELLGGHSHDTADQVDEVLEADADGRRALLISLVGLAATAAIQAIVVILAILLGAGGVALGWREADPIIGLAITVAILGVPRSAVRQVGARLMDAVDPALVDQATAAVTSVEGIDAVRTPDPLDRSHPARGSRRHRRRLIERCPSSRPGPPRRSAPTGPGSATDRRDRAHLPQRSP